MSVRIRLRRIGRKKQPSYRVVVTDSAAPRDGAYLEAVGFYNPRRQPAELRVNLERVDAWLGHGAGMSDTVASLVRKARRGGDAKVELMPMASERVAAAEPEAAPADSAAPGGRVEADVAAAPPAEAAAPEALDTGNEAIEPAAPRASAPPEAGAPARPEEAGPGPEPDATRAE